MSSTVFHAYLGCFAYSAMFWLFGWITQKLSNGGLPPFGGYKCRQNCWWMLLFGMDPWRDRFFIRLAGFQLFAWVNLVVGFLVIYFRGPQNYLTVFLVLMIGFAVFGYILSRVLGQ